MTIQLAFEPRGRDGASDAYFVCEKRNACVVCGGATHFLRYHVIPSCFRRNLPAQWKSHRSHDVVCPPPPTRSRAHARAWRHFTSFGAARVAGTALRGVPRGRGEGGGDPKEAALR
jgi:hypothetical protein